MFLTEGRMGGETSRPATRGGGRRGSLQAPVGHVLYSLDIRMRWLQLSGSCHISWCYLDSFIIHEAQRATLEVYNLLLFPTTRCINKIHRRWAAAQVNKHL